MAVESKRIIKNTGLLYIRMLLLMAVSLYTSRILLYTLGVSDYGLYNVVAGVVVMIGFFKGTMGTASSRFITVALSRNQIAEMRETFSSLFFINVLLAITIVVLAESVGLWFLLEKMTIPEDRVSAAFWVYQFSVISVALSIVTVPYHAVIIAHERMGAFAYISLFDAFAKLVVVYLTAISSYDRLIFYAFLILLIHIINVLIYVFYSLRKFSEAKLKFKINRALIHEMFGFIGWSSYGSLVSVGFTQGLNVLLNIFFGPTVNAARGIAVQVQSAVTHFITNFQTAINPQLVKSTATKDFAGAQQLVIASSKYSFFLMCILGIPIIVEAPFILGLWLKEVPLYSVPFCRIILVICIFSSLANALRRVNQAEGNIKKFQMCECTLLLMIIPLSYIALKLWQIPIIVFVIHLVIELISQYVRIILVIPKIEMTSKKYINQILIRVLPVFILPLAIALPLHKYISTTPFVTFLITSFVSEFIMIIIIYYFGMLESERMFLYKIIRKHKR